MQKLAPAAVGIVDVEHLHFQWSAERRVLVVVFFHELGHFLIARQALRLLKAQGLGGAFVFVATKNVMSPGKDFSAYSASKAAEAQLAKVLALRDRWDESGRRLGQALAVHPSNPLLRLARACVLLRQKDNDGALAAARPRDGAATGRRWGRRECRWQW